MIYDVSSLIKEKEATLKFRVSLLHSMGIAPHLTVIQANDDFASNKYVENKIKKATELGIKTTHIKREFKNNESVIEEIKKAEGSVIVQLPLGDELDETVICQSIKQRQDADCFSSNSIHDIFLTGLSPNMPCTPAGVMDILYSRFGTLEGLSVCIINRSNIVGKPLALMLINAGSTVTVCNSHTKDLSSITRAADVIVTAVGKPNFITPNMLSVGAFVVDVSINRGQDGKVCGDCSKVLYDDPKYTVTKVPGSVGPLTILHLLENTVRNASR